jgi:hypothetical protein
VDVAVELHAMPVLAAGARPLPAAPDSGGATPHPGPLPAPAEAEAPPQPPAGAGRRRRRRTLLAAAVVLLLGLGAAFAVFEVIARTGQPAPRGAGPARTTPLRLLVPAYIYPSNDGLAQWDRIIASPAAAITVVIANTQSGPGEEVDPNYVRVLDRARQGGVTVIGYVPTKYGDRPLDDVKGDVDRWVQLYPGIQGIFFDEQASTADRVDYYRALYEHARGKHGLSLVVTDPGTECAEAYLARPATDVGCLVEAPTNFGTYRRPAWTDRYTADHFAALLCKVGTAEQMRKAVREMRDNNIGYCFVTDADEPNPWGRLPTYWDAELDAVRQANAP